MIAVPFIYFTLLSIYIYRRNHEIDLAFLTSLVYAISGFFAILIDIFDLRSSDVAIYDISLEATVAYCGLLTMCMLPIIYHSHFRITDIHPISNERLLRFLAWLTFIWFAFTTMMGWQNMMNVLTGDMAQYRADINDGWGQESWMTSLPTPLRFIAAVFNSFIACPWTLIFLAFFFCYVQKMQKKYFFLFLSASLNGPLSGIIGADRSKTAYWIMALVAMYIFFRHKINSAAKRKILTYGVLIIGLLSLYLSAMTIARFGEKNYGNMGGTEGGLIYYFGQSFVNFCYYFDNYEPPFMHLGIIFPFVSEHILGIPSGGVVIQRQMTDITGLWTGVFYTFIGQIIVGAGKSVAIVYCLGYTILSSILLRAISKSKKFTASSMYLYFAFFSVIYLGLFGHYYTSSSITFGLITMYLFMRFLDIKKI